MLHGEETRVWGDQTYKSQGEIIRAKAAQGVRLRSTGSAMAALHR
jgi:hypothetical protein